MESAKPGKKRREHYNLPLHRRRKQLSARLSKELDAKFKRRNFPVAKGDKVKVMRGKFRGREGKVTKVDMRRFKIGIEGIAVKKPDGKEKPIPIHPSNVMIMEMKPDRRREDALARNIRGQQVGKNGQ